MRAPPSLLGAWLFAVLAGCLPGLHLTEIKSVFVRPSNVAVYFKVETLGGDPVGGLAAGDFKVYEDDSLIPQAEGKQTILNASATAAHYTLLLVDMSGSVAQAGNVEKVVDAASSFTERLEKLQQKVAVYAFDGSADLHPIVPFAEATGSAGLKQLLGYKPADPSTTNLNGAVVKAIDELDAALAHANKPLKFGTLVVFAAGTDHAARVPGADMRAKVRETKLDVFAIGLGGEVNERELHGIGKDGTSFAADKDNLGKAFDTVGSRIETATRSYYLFSYCSPARAGTHIVRIEASFKDSDGKNEQTGSLRRQFDAEGFGSGCDPGAPEGFEIAKTETLTPAPSSSASSTASSSASSAPAPSASSAPSSPGSSSSTEPKPLPPKPTPRPTPRPPPPRPAATSAPPPKPPPTSAPPPKPPPPSSNEVFNP